MNQNQTPTRVGGRNGGYSTGRGRGRSPRGFHQSADSRSAVRVGVSLSDDIFSNGGPTFDRRRQPSWSSLGSGISTHHTPDAKASSFPFSSVSHLGSNNSECSPDSTHEDQTSSLSSEQKRESKLTNVKESAVKAIDTGRSLNLGRSFMDSVENLHNQPEMPVKSAADSIECSGMVNERAQSFLQTRSAHKVESSDPPECLGINVPFDICPKRHTSVKLKPSLLAMNKERRNEMKRSATGPEGKMLRPGMVLLKGYFPISEQAQIVKLCRELGLGPGGFYEPSFKNGAKMNLRMMCLGKNWDPEKHEYGEFRPRDGAKPPPIPNEFLRLVQRVTNDSNILMAEKMHAKKEHKLPSLSPDICIVNFYTNHGRLGIHQDRDESTDSILQGLPVVSFSIGEAADFLYCDDQRDESKAENIVLESGDVLIFGGESREIFHGVSKIGTNTAPRSLIDETGLRPGRLNLTFRKY